MNGNVIELNEAIFDREVLHATQPVLVEFWATSDEPLTMLTKMLRRAGVATDHDPTAWHARSAGWMSTTKDHLEHGGSRTANSEQEKANLC